MFERFKLHIEQNFPFLLGAKLLIGVSGGIDSIVLTHLCQKLGCKFAIAHCNFKLRGSESDEDEVFVKKLTYTPSNQIFINSFVTEKYAKHHKVSVQVAARQLRYQWFEELQKKHQFDFILTAHNADDNLETFILHLTRGTGLDGFTGIPAKKNDIVRPLLAFSREEIHTYAIENHIDWREDSSNSSTKYTRNKIRHQVVPVLKEINPQLLDSFSNTLSYLQQGKTILQDRIKDIRKKVSITIFENGAEIQKINCASLKQLTDARAYLYELLKPYNFTAWKDIYDLLESQSGKQVISHTHRIIKDREYLLLTELDNAKDNFPSVIQIQKDQQDIKQPIALKFEDSDVSKPSSKAVIFVDKDLLNYPLQLRRWKKGDYFYPTGMMGKKKVSKYFKDEKLSLLEKENTWLLTNADQEIIWILNRRQDRRYQATNQSKNSVKISCITNSF